MKKNVPLNHLILVFLLIAISANATFPYNGQPLAGVISTADPLEAYYLNSQVTKFPYSRNAMLEDLYAWKTPNNWSVEGQAYLQHAAHGSRMSIAGSDAWSNYKITARVEMTSTNSDFGSEIGLIGRYGSFTDYYCAGYDFSSSKMYIKRVSKNDVQRIAGCPFSMEPHTPYTFTFVLDGDSLLFSIGDKTLRATDKHLSKGKIGIATINGTATFGDIKVEDNRNNVLLADTFSDGNADGWMEDTILPARIKNMLAMHDAGIPVAWCVTWKDLNDIAYIPSGAQKAADLELLNDWLVAFGKYIAIYTVGLEPWLAYSTELKTADAQGKVPCVEWMRELAAQAKKTIANHPELLGHLKIGSGALQGMYRISSSTSTKEEIDFVDAEFAWVNSDENIDYVDTHLHQLNAQEISQAVTYLKSRTPKDIITTEWSEGTAGVEWGKERIDPAFASRWGISTDLKNSSYLNACRETPVSKAQWDDFIAGAPFDDDLIPKAIRDFNGQGVKISTYGAFDQHNAGGWDLKQVFATQTVVQPDDGSLAENHMFPYHFRRVTGQKPYIMKDAFDRGASQWDVLGGSWSIIRENDNKKLQQTDPSADAACAVIGTSDWRNYGLTTTLKPVSLSGGSSFGLHARYTDESNTYSAAYRVADSQLVISKTVHGVQTDLVSKPYRFNAGDSRKVTFKIEGTQLTLYVNNTRELSTSDQTFSNGRAALFTYRSQASFDNVLFAASEFADTFSDQECTDWSHAGDGTWSIENINGDCRLCKAGTTDAASYALNGNSSWVDVTMRAKIRVQAFADNSIIGLVTGFKDEENYLSAEYVHSEQKLHIRKKLNNTITTLGSCNFIATPNTDHVFKLAVSGNTYSLYVNDVLKIKATDSNSLKTGQFGAYVYHASAYFDDVLAISK